MTWLWTHKVRVVSKSTIVQGDMGHVKAGWSLSLDQDSLLGLWLPEKSTEELKDLPTSEIYEVMGDAYKEQSLLSTLAYMVL